ncbi:achaete-scute complex protein T3-like [Zerene cesonia]|uniref:achaete-scute complex protein T3-like n=1 Tax=Zerene cesonia TaxID=33412 RepID=UPI0018E51134|nr:achaete-scute complex protein T3-like [Zerene cesonia]
MSYVSYKNDLPKYVPIAPTTEDLDMDTVPRKYSYKSNPYTGAQAASIARRNARERNRVKQVNDGFNALRKRLPAAVINALSGGARRGTGKKLSKVDTLRMVVEYIRYLENLIEESDAELGVTKAPMDTSITSDIDEGVYGGRNSPYAESVPSPVNSECSSGVSSSYSINNEYYAPPVSSYQNEYTSMHDNELLDAISWWQAK